MYFKIALSSCLCLVFFLSFRKLTSLPCLVCSLLFQSGVAEWSFIGDIDTGVVYSRKPTYVDFSADCTEANTLSVS